MMMREDRKAAAAAFKERKMAAGIYLVRCTASGELWAGRARDLTSIRNRIWFTLDHGLNQPASLLDAWRRHGADAFSFEIAEQFAEEDLGGGLERRLRERLAGWVERLGAVAI